MRFFYCILYEIIHQMIYYMKVIFEHTKILKISASSGVFPMCVTRFSPPPNDTTACNV